MNITTILALLQAAAALLGGVSANPNASAASRQAAIEKAGQIVQISTQALPGNDIPRTSVGNVLTTDDLDHAAFLRATRGWTLPGSDVTVLKDTAVFGDLNGDGADDAAVIVRRTRADGTSEFALAVFLRQGDSLFNIGDTPVGANPIVFSRAVTDGEIVIDMRTDAQARAVSRYALLGNALIKEE